MFTSVGYYSCRCPGIFLFSTSTYLPLSHLSSVEEGIPVRLITSHSLQIDQQEVIRVPRTLLELEENRHLHHALQDLESIVDEVGRKSTGAGEEQSGVEYDPPNITAQHLY